MALSRGKGDVRGGYQCLKDVTMSSCPACGRPVIRRRYAGALAGLARAHVDRFEVCVLVLAVAEPAPPDLDRLRRCG